MLIFGLQEFVISAKNNKQKSLNILMLGLFNSSNLECYSCSKYFSIIVMADSEITVPGPNTAATFLSNK